MSDTFSFGVLVKQKQSDAIIIHNEDPKGLVMATYKSANIVLFIIPSITCLRTARYTLKCLVLIDQ